MAPYSDLLKTLILLVSHRFWIEEHRRKMRKDNKGAFTLLELLIVIGIISILSAITVLFISPSILNKVRASAAANDQRQLQSAAVLYRTHIGFYPPDVDRGWDPGFAKALPHNPDTGEDCAVNPGQCPSCPNCPSDWKTRVQNNWQGYLSAWPQRTPWGGRYDYNYWSVETLRSGCTVPPGIYVGVQGDYSNQNTVPASAEQLMLDRGIDSDGCLNGESQMLLRKL